MKHLVDLLGVYMEVTDKRLILSLAFGLGDSITFLGIYLFQGKHRKNVLEAD